MIMQMKYGLTGVGAAIDDDTEPAVSQPIVARELCRDCVNFADQRPVFGRNVQDCRDVLPWHDEKMQRRLRTDVSKRNHRVVLVNKVSFDLSLDDAAEQTIVHGSSSSTRSEERRVGKEC